MEIKQIATILNSVSTELLGESAILTEDLSNIVAMGDAFMTVVGIDHYVKSLVDHIGKVVFTDRVYTGRAPKILMDGWEFGSVLEKVSMDLPSAEENESWELEHGAVVDNQIFYKPSVYAKFWNKKTTYDIPMSICDKQVKSAFSSATQMNAFVSMIYNAIANAVTLNTDGLIMRTINNMIAETIHAEYGANSISGGSHVKAVNLLYLYNQLQGVGSTLTVDEALVSKDFYRFVAKTLKDYKVRMSVLSTLFNIGGKERFTPADKLEVVMHSDFVSGAEAYLSSDTFHNEFVALPNASVVPFWQASGTDFDFDTTAEIKVTTASGDSVDVTGVLAVMFDHDACGVCNVDKRTTSHWNAKGEFTNIYTKVDAEYFNDTNENCVVFFVA